MQFKKLRWENGRTLTSTSERHIGFIEFSGNKMQLFVIFYYGVGECTYKITPYLPMITKAAHARTLEEAKARCERMWRSWGKWTTEEAE